jgi:anaerobic magnesium-protoporphyrin IX monomethyl ester cyclase
MKVLLAYLCQYRDRHDYFLSIMPVGLVSIAAHIEEQGHEVTLANFSSVGPHKALKQIITMKPEVIGLSLFTHNRADTLKLARDLKRVLPGSIIVLGGPHATFLAGEILGRYPEIDYIIQGEGEQSFSELLKSLDRGELPAEKVIASQTVKNIDALPAPGTFSGNMIGIDAKEQFHFIITSRGCPCTCVFCSSPAFWRRKVRFRSPESIFQEIQSLHKKYGIRYFSLRDDNFTMNKKRVLTFCRQLRESGLYIMWNCQARVDTIDEEMLIAMKRAGLEHIQYGVESGSAGVLQRYDKDITIDDIRRAAALTRRVGVYLSIYLMAGMEGETRDDIERTKALIVEILPTDGIVSPVALYPGTELYESEKRQGRISDSIWFAKKDPGIFLRTDGQVETWMTELLHELERIQKRSLYREADFMRHRKVAGEDCWVTDILEGDYYCNKGRLQEAEQSYQSVIKRHPQNTWGFLRIARLKDLSGKDRSAKQS